MSYRSEMEEVRTTVPTYVPFSTTTEDLPEGYMIECDGNKFRPRHYVDYVVPATARVSETHVKGWIYFYQGRSTITFSSFDEAKAFIDGFVSFLQWMGGIAAPTEESEEETYEDMLAAQYNERLAGQVVYYTENIDQSERVARLLKASRSGVLLADPADRSDLGCWYAWNEVSNIQRGRQSGWEPDREGMARL